MNACLKIFFFSFVCLLFVICSVYSERSFIIDYENDCFLKDGEPFRYVSGSIHYFRVPYQLWSDRLYKMKMAGLNVIQTYVEWSHHEPEPGVFNFDYNYDLVAFLEEAQRQGLLVILRPGPFIDAERDMGGLPYWLMRVKPNITLRSYDGTYIKYVDRWFNYLLPMIDPLLYSNGGPIIMIQIENEYGCIGLCNAHYTSHLRNLYQHYFKDEVVLFTTDNSNNAALTCGKIDGVFSTFDFGTHGSILEKMDLMRWHRAKGPFVNSEFYAGWLDHWGAPHASISTQNTVETLNDMLLSNFSVNIYMFHGGTSFGFDAGSSLGRTFQACPTSYDYDAPLSEAGDPTPKYYAIRDVIGKFLPLPRGPLPEPAPKLNFGPVLLTETSSIFSFLSRTHGDFNSFESEFPLSFEDLHHPYGFVLYETRLSFVPTDPILLEVPEIADRGYVYVDEELQGILSREQKIESLSIRIKYGQKLSILVENQGRICSGPIRDRKGIFSNVTLGSKQLFNWKMYPINLEQNFIQSLDNFPIWRNVKKGGSRLYQGTFKVNSSSIQDTFLKLDGWHRGVAFINGYNLGRYWPIVGPQLTLYVPKTHLNALPSVNTITLLELEGSPCDSPSDCIISLIDEPVLNGTTPQG